MSELTQLFTDRVYNENSEEAIKQCQVLLEEPNVDTAVRIGDLFGFIIEHYTRKERWKAVSPVCFLAANTFGLEAPPVR